MPFSSSNFLVGDYLHWWFSMPLRFAESRIPSKENGDETEIMADDKAAKES